MLNAHKAFIADLLGNMYGYVLQITGNPRSRREDALVAGILAHHAKDDVLQILAVRAQCPEGPSMRRKLQRSR